MKNLEDKLDAKVVVVNGMNNELIEYFQFFVNDRQVQYDEFVKHLNSSARHILNQEIELQLKVNSHNARTSVYH